LSNSTTKEELLAEARRRRADNDFHGALGIYRSLEEAHPEDAGLPYLTGMTCWLLGQKKQARHHIERALNAGHTGDGAWFNYGLLLHETGDPAGAIDAYRRALELTPALPDVHNNMGLAWKELGNHEAAIDAFKKELELHPDHVGACLNLAAVLEVTGEYQAAERYCLRALDLNPESEDVHAALGDNARKRHQPKAALEHYLNALKYARARKHEAYVYYRTIAEILDETGRYDELGNAITFDQPIDVEFPGMTELQTLDKAADLVFFMVGDGVAPYAEIMTRSALTASQGGLNVIQLSDQDTQTVVTASGIIRTDVNEDELMFARQQLYAAWLSQAQRDCILLDTDLVVQDDLAGVFGDWDIGLTLRDPSDRLRRVMPFNEGVMFCRATAAARRFWGAVLHIYRQLPVPLRQWSGGQISLGILLRKQLEQHDGDLLEVDGIRIKLLPKELYNYAPGTEDEDLSGRAIVHYHGGRKQWMLNRYGS
jgi:Flp pilus assembly protein TadD